MEVYGKLLHLLPDLTSGEREFYFRYLRMNAKRFKHLLNLVKNKISKEDAKFRRNISPRKSLSWSKRVLVTGISQQSLSFTFRIAKTTVRKKLRKTSEQCTIP